MKKKLNILIYTLLAVALVIITIALQLMFKGDNISAIIFAVIGIGLVYVGDRLDKKQKKL